LLKRTAVVTPSAKAHTEPTPTIALGARPTSGHVAPAAADTAGHVAPAAADTARTAWLQWFETNTVALSVARP
jgi:hypothetical protein